MKARAISADNFMTIDFDIDQPHKILSAFIRERCPVQPHGFVKSDLVLEATKEKRDYEYIGNDAGGVRIYREIYPVVQRHAEETSK